MVYKHSKLSHWNSTSRSLCLIISVPRYFWLKILKNTLSDMLIKPHLLLLVCMVAHWWELITSSAKAVYSNPILNPISRCLFQNCAKIKIKKYLRIIGLPTLFLAPMIPGANYQLNFWYEWIQPVLNIVSINDLEQFGLKNSIFKSNLWTLNYPTYCKNYVRLNYVDKSTGFS